MRLESGEVVGILLFATDILLIASSPSDLATLSSFLESWCSDFKMLVSVAKTNVISPDDNFVCSISCDGFSEAAVVSRVASYKYLRVNLYLEPHPTSRHRGDDMIRLAQLYKNVILSGWRFLPDRVRSLYNLVFPGCPWLPLRSRCDPSPCCRCGQPRLYPEPGGKGDPSGSPVHGQYGGPS